jgi:hypothetical protein
MNANTPCISQTYTLDPTGKLSDLHFMVLAYYSEEDTYALIGDKFNCSGKWTEKKIEKIYTILKVQSRQGAVDKAWKDKIFNDANRHEDAEWRKRRFRFEGKRFYEIVEV